MLKVLSYILCDLDPKVKVIGQKASICDGVPSTSALVQCFVLVMEYIRGSGAPECIFHNKHKTLYNLFSPDPAVSCVGFTS